MRTRFGKQLRFHHEIMAEKSLLPIKFTFKMLKNVLQVVSLEMSSLQPLESSKRHFLPGLFSKQNSEKIVFALSSFNLSGRIRSNKQFKAFERRPYPMGVRKSPDLVSSA